MYFNPPEIITAEVFARLPDELRAGEPDPELSAFQPRGQPALSLLEGPSFDREGNLWCVDVPAGQIYRVSPDGAFELMLAYDGWPNGLKIHRDGRIFVADYKNGIMEFDPVSRSIRPFVVRAQLERLKAVNDLFFAGNGDLYFTDQGLTGHQDPAGRLFRVDGSGRARCLLDRVPSPNGLVMNADETALYLAVTRANAVWRVPFTAEGEATKVGTFLQLSGGVGPDGLALTAEGGVAVAHFGLGSVWIFSEIGEPLYRVISPEGLHVTNLAFGGPERRDLYMTEAGSASILRARLPISGMPMYSHS